MFGDALISHSFMEAFRLDFVVRFIKKTVEIIILLSEIFV